jgi:hypothetical protein
MSQSGKILYILYDGHNSHMVGQTMAWFTKFAKLATEEEIRTLDKLLTFQ